jgi:glutamyl-tRNA synthetase
MDTPVKPVRTRFAPSPTGFLHIGGIRSSFFNYLFAKNQGGSFILRLEDTDRERFVPEAEAHLVESLKWLGIPADEGIGGKDAGFGPYVQSERLEIYAKHSAELVEKGSLYPCWCTPERLQGLREEAQKNKVAFKYDRHCLNNPDDITKPHVVRFKMPGNEVVAWDDVVRGTIEFNSDELDDFVAIKSDGFPTYQFANVVDDHLMEISHVLRADEWIPSTPKHILLYKAFGWEVPLFAHLPAVTAPGGGKKLSKRHGAKSALELRDEGYLPGAVLNFLAALGWNEGDGSTQEIYSLDELISKFSLERVQKSSAVFDAERLVWLNGVYIRNMSLDDLYIETTNFWPESAKSSDDTYKKEVLGLIHERLKFMAEIPELTEFFFTRPVQVKDTVVDKLNQETARTWLSTIIEKLKDSDFSHDALETTLRGLVEELGGQTGKVFSLVRRSATGSPVAPGLFETLHTLGKEESLARLQEAYAIISA